MGKSRYDPRIKDLMTLATLANPLRSPVAALYRLRGQQRVAALVGVAGRQSGDGATKLVARRDALRRRFLESMDGLDVLIGPPCAVPAVTHGATRQLGPASVSYTLLVNTLAWPAGVVAATRVRLDEQEGRSRSRDEVDEAARKVDQGSAGLPVGVQVIARPGREDLILAVMAELEARFRERPDYPATPVSPP
jgi:fatty acid amide hydrolase